MVQFDKGFEKEGRWIGFTKEERAKMKEILKDTYCQCEESKCSLNCDMLHICDKCYEEAKLTPFCLWTFEDIVYEKKIIRDVDGDTVCESHGHKEIDRSLLNGSLKEYKKMPFLWRKNVLCSV